MRILMLPGSHASPQARFRVYQYCEHLEKSGHCVTVRVIKPERQWSSTLPSVFGSFHSRVGALIRVLSALWLTLDSASFDIVFMQRDIVPETSVIFLEPLLRRRRNNLVFDFDDAIFLGARDKKMQRFLPMCSLVIAGNEYLANFARPHNNNVVVIPTVVDTERYFPSAIRKNQIPCIGWSGSSSTVTYDLPGIWPILERLSEKFEFEFLVVADTLPKNIPVSVRVNFIPWSPGSEVSTLQKMDVGIMPLIDDPRTRGKCGAKLITYGAVGIPSVASAVGANNEIILHGKTGFLCKTEEEWYKCLKTLVTNEPLIKRMGEQARTHIEANYSLSIWAPRLVDHLSRVANSKMTEDG